MTDWATIASLATAGGTLVLAIATFSSVRSANRTAKISERAFLVGLRPVLFASKNDDANQKIRWGDDHWATLAGGRGVAEEVDGIIYLGISLRNVGAGIGVLHGWRIATDPASVADAPPVSAFRPQGRDLYVPPGDTGFWQAAIREPGDDDRAHVTAAVRDGTMVTIDLLYGDHEGGQRTISRFMLSPFGEPGERAWLAAVGRHWTLDQVNPRPAG